jgi:hypothetical protein
MLESTSALVIFCCKIKYDFKFTHRGQYKICNKFNEDIHIFVEESQLYSVMSDISDLDYEDFKLYCENFNKGK